MRPQELTIGDWVFIEDAEKPNGLAYTKVVCLTEDNTEWLHPIPLTEEILKANGFEDGCYMTLEYYGKQIEICLAGNIPMYVRNVGSWEYSLPHPTYVHELQHALRLCGLNEFADNFKIK